jgi:GNAT superfamily N-acetyltransferase
MLTIRPATSNDVQTIVNLITALAVYENAEAHEVNTTPELIRRFGFTEPKRFECLIAEWEGVAAGFALYFYNFSTWEARPGIYLEDLFVLPEHRKRGIGLALFKALASVALHNDCTRIVWQVLDWNELAIRFYQSLGARCMSEWDTYRLEGESIRRLAAQ